MTACLSLPLAAVLLFVLSLLSDALFPAVLRSGTAVGIMSLAAAAELAVLLAAVLFISYIRDRKTFLG